jgi:hypothetical protein
MSRTYRALTVLALSGALAIGTTAVAVAAEDVNDQRKALYQSELEQNLAGGTADRTQAAVEQARAGERSLDPAPVVTIAPQPVPAAADPGIDPLAVLLLGLVGGLAGGAAILAGWTAANRRHAHRVVAA